MKQLTEFRKLYFFISSDMIDLIVLFSFSFGPLDSGHHCGLMSGPVKRLHERLKKARNNICRGILPFSTLGPKMAKPTSVLCSSQPTRTTGKHQIFSVIHHGHCLSAVYLAAAPSQTQWSRTRDTIFSTKLIFVPC